MGIESDEEARAFIERLSNENRKLQKAHTEAKHTFVCGARPSRSKSELFDDLEVLARVRVTLANDAYDRFVAALSPVEAISLDRWIQSRKAGFAYYAPSAEPIVEPANQDTHNRRIRTPTNERGKFQGLIEFWRTVIVSVPNGDLIAFVAAVVLSWLFEWTPEGVKRDGDVDRTAPVDSRSRQRLNYAIIALLVVALAVSTTFNVREEGSTPRPRSIAVLPLISVSNNPDNELFASGIHDDLLSRLANIHSLKVISRTSVMEYRNTTRNVRQIGEELGVEAILEGGVQRIGDSVRINLQLIDARTDEHLWAETYDRRLTMENIFTV